MSLLDLPRLGTLLGRIARPPLGAWPARKVCELADRVSDRGLHYDCYQHRSASRSLIVALHGVSTNSKQDPRLQHFGRCLAASGSTCLVPELPGLAKLRWTSEDIDALAGFIQDLEPKEKAVGLVGFSYAASYALLVAARPQVAGRIAFVLAVSAYHSLTALYDHYLADRETFPDTERQWDDKIYLHLIMAKRNQERLNLPAEAVAGMDSLLRRYCHSASMQEKQAFFRRHLRDRDLIALDHKFQDRDELVRLSPAGRLGSLRCRVGLLHDPADSLVPRHHALSMAAQLRACACDHRLLISPLLSHVGLSGALNPPEWIRMLSILMPLVQVRTGGRP